MRKKLYIGVFVAAIVGIAVGGALFNRSGAQDKKKSEEKKVEGNLFDTLKKDLEAKKELPAVTLPPAPGAVTFPPLEGKKEPLVFPPLSDTKEEAKKKEPAPPISPLPEPPLSVPAPVIVNEKPMPEPPKQTLPPSEPKPPLTDGPPKKDALTFPPLQPATDQPKTLTFPPVVPSQGGLELPPPAVAPQVDPQPIPRRISKNPAIAENMTDVRNCPWSLQVDMADGKTVVIATVNKKHEFKIVCANLELQTGKGTMRAGGTVQISGDMLNGSCEELTISLHDDRIALKGGAAVTIQKVTTTVSDTKPAAFELKGETLNLRISEIESGKVTQASWPSLPSSPRPIVVGSQTTTPIAPVSTRRIGESPISSPWTGYGVLRRTKELHDGRTVWCLEGRDGRRFERFVVREGGKLDSYEGQTISVYLQSDKVMSYATHIALP